MDAPYRTLRSITKWLRWILIALSLAQAANIIGLIFQYRLLAAAQTGSFGVGFVEAARSNDQRQAAIGVFSLVLLLAMVIVFFRWVYRSMANVRGLGAVGVETPARAVGGFFIPFANAIFPYISMSQIWRGSENAPSWANGRTSALVGIWWALWLAVGLFSFVLLFESKGMHGIAAIIDLTLAQSAFNATEIVRNLLTIALITRITTLQEAQHARAENQAAIFS
jgi:hypothetical protein